MMLWLPQQTHHGLSLAPVLLALVRVMRTCIATVSEGDNDDECMSLDRAKLQRTPCDRCVRAIMRTLACVRICVHACARVCVCFSSSLSLSLFVSFSLSLSLYPCLFLSFLFLTLSCSLHLSLCISVCLCLCVSASVLLCVFVLMSDVIQQILSTNLTKCPVVVHQQ